MAEPSPVRRALLSVSDKSGLIDFARALADMGIDLISTGGTARAIREAGIPVRDVAEVTGFPEMMDGRIKTLHAKIHGGILARRDAHADALREHGIDPIDLVCINLYPFEQTVARHGVTRDEAIEQIDIGGPAMVRSAAKNSDWVAVVTSPSQYAEVVEAMRSSRGAVPEALRRRLAAAAFARTAAYDGAIADWLLRHESDASTPASLVVAAERIQELRYGENPHQSAALYRARRETPSIVEAKQLHGKELSYNNILDADAALALAVALRALDPGRPGACVIKHTNPCGASVAPSARDAVDLAIAGDPLAAFGGILAVNATVDQPAAERIGAEGSFFEVVIAPAFEPGALDLLRERWKNVRLLEVGPLDKTQAAAWDLRSVRGGLLLQQRDRHIGAPAEWTHRAGPAADESQLAGAAFLETCVRALTSNAVVIGGPDGAGVRIFGSGAGQMDRVAACRLAIEKAGERAQGAVAVSDAFFPFSDGPELLIDAGVGCIVHPGGSKRDQDTFDLCDARGVACYTTGVRRFRH